MNQNKLIRSTIYGIAWAAFIYGCISFFEMDLNAAHWSPNTRFAMVGFGFIMGAYISVIIAMKIHGDTN